VRIDQRSNPYFATCWVYPLKAQPEPTTPTVIDRGFAELAGMLNKAKMELTVPVERRALFITRAGAHIAEV